MSLPASWTALLTRCGSKSSQRALRVAGNASSKKRIISCNLIFGSCGTSQREQLQAASWSNATDLLCGRFGWFRPMWGSASLTADGAARREYIASLREADEFAFNRLIKFVVS